MCCIRKLFENIKKQMNMRKFGSHSDICTYNQTELCSQFSVQRKALMSLLIISHSKEKQPLKKLLGWVQGFSCDVDSDLPWKIQRELLIPSNIVCAFLFLSLWIICLWQYASVIPLNYSEPCHRTCFKSLRETLIPVKIAYSRSYT